jgi:hypothetical protein
MVQSEVKREEISLHVFTEFSVDAFTDELKLAKSVALDLKARVGNYKLQFGAIR